MNKKISIIIVTYNSERDIYDCLASVYQYNDIGDELEIIVVDNCSRDYDKMYKKIQQLYGDKVIVVSNTTNGGYGQGNNVGIQLATAPIIAIMNPDIRLIMPIFETAVETLQQKDMIMCGGKQYYDSTRKAISYYPLYTLPPLFRFIIRYIATKKDIYIDRYMWLQGAFFFIRKDAFADIGYFDEKIFMYGEEMDIHLRLRKWFKNAKFIYLQQHKYIHLAGDREFSEKQVERQLRSLTYVAQKQGLTAVEFLQRERRYTQLENILGNIANRIHHRPSTSVGPLLNVIDKLIQEYANT